MSVVRPRTRASLAVLLGLLLVALTWLPAGPATAAGHRLTNVAHLDFLLDEVSPSPVTGHSTYRLGPGSAEDPTVLMPDLRRCPARRTFERVRGGAKDPVTGDYAQGAFNTDDIARAAVVYLRAWHQPGEPASRDQAYQLLRAVAFSRSPGPSRREFRAVDAARRRSEPQRPAGRAAGPVRLGPQLLAGPRVELLTSASLKDSRVSVGTPGHEAVVSVYDRSGHRAGQMSVPGQRTVTIPAQGYALLEGE